MNTGECMEYAQRLCDAQTAAERNAARADLRAAIDAAVAAEREDCARLCDAKAKRSNELRASEKRATVARLLAVAEGRSVELALAIRARQTD